MNFYVAHFQLILYRNTEFIFSNIWLVKFYLRWVIMNYQANLYLILVTFLFEFYVIMWSDFTWNVRYVVFTVYYGELRLNKVSENEDNFFRVGADSWYSISLEILTVGENCTSWIDKIPETGIKNRVREYSQEFIWEKKSIGRENNFLRWKKYGIEKAIPLAHYCGTYAELLCFGSSVKWWAV